MNIVFVASECSPFCKTGGLADVIGSLPSALRKQGANIRVILPKYSVIDDAFKQEMHHMTSFTVHVSWRKQYCGIETLTKDGITYYFIDNEYYFKRDHLYGYDDDAERFIFFCHAVLEALPMLDIKPHILHCHDWQTALIPAYVRTTYQDHPVYKHTKTVFTIHNLKYQGISSPTIFQDMLHFPPEHYYSLEFNHTINFMKGAIVHAHLVTTVSETYAAEIQTEYYGEGLHQLLTERNTSIVGIVNGINTGEYNPETDRHLHFHYLHCQQGKEKNKAVLQEQVGLPVRNDIPVISVVTRLVEQKGLPLIQHVFAELMSLDIQFILLGTGDAEFEQFFLEAQSRYKDKVSVHLTFNEAFARQIYAGSDFFLMPSRFEPCGIGQLLALRYETVPIVRETGGLADTVIPFDTDTQTGYGFTFENYNAHDMLYTVQYAVSIFHEKEKWHRLLANIYDTNFSWDESAKRYQTLYHNIL
ncbi:glycogen synthase GlgA [Alkalihalobacillus sp. LMS39]|uniref:glycogen synthase GlgA n=1 Tax=Alkalihalobacillus sp. LMS39 TaxID=2924032 RepID=UPI001FB309E2|nr:glycogen synthase GlgA [Alkalihalobacillus sp. LMS39]UOE95393.1 glycogen synthase GlgA [Alkalihalobacillus sp. LMS39]